MVVCSSTARLLIFNCNIVSAVSQPHTVAINLLIAPCPVFILLGGDFLPLPSVPSLIPSLTSVPRISKPLPLVYVGSGNEQRCVRGGVVVVGVVVVVVVVVLLVVVAVVVDSAVVVGIVVVVTVVVDIVVVVVMSQPSSR